MRAASLAGARTYAAPVRPFACARRPGRATGASEATAGTGGPGARPCGPDDVRRALPCRPAGLRSISVCPGASRAPTKSWDASTQQRHKAKVIGETHAACSKQEPRRWCTERIGTEPATNAATFKEALPRPESWRRDFCRWQRKQSRRSGAGRPCQMQAPFNPPALYYYSYLALVPSGGTAHMLILPSDHLPTS